MGSQRSSPLDSSLSYLDLSLRVVLDQVLQLTAEHGGRHGVLGGGGESNHHGLIQRKLVNIDEDLQRQEKHK